MSRLSPLTSLGIGSCVPSDRAGLRPIKGEVRKCFIRTHRGSCLLQRDVRMVTLWDLDGVISSSEPAQVWCPILRDST